MYSLERKTWDADFFKKEIYLLSGMDAEAGLDGLDSDLHALDTSGVFATEVQLNVRLMRIVPELERLGFRLVDSRMEFITHSTRLVDNVVPERGEFRRYLEKDWDALVNITRRSFVENSAFQSRYNNRWLFSEEESLRYYVEWHKWVLRTSPDLFVSWVDGDQYVGFYSILRKNNPENAMPVYKVGLAAIEPEYRALNGQNLMQAWLFHNTPDLEWTTINSPQLTNTSGLKNNIRSGKKFAAIELFLFRKNPALDGVISK
jgi:hypothetical protein